MTIRRTADPVSVVLFDVGGVLVELSGVADILKWSDNKISVDELWRRWLHSPAVRAFETGRMHADLFAANVVEELNINIAPQVFLEAFVRWPVGLYPNTLEMLTAIPKRYSIALLSNSNSLHWSRVHGEMGLGAAIEHHFVSHLIGKIKPDAEAFLHVTESLQCKPQEIFFLDDNQLNIDAAIKVGMQAVRVCGVEEARAALVAAQILTS